jgi:hypothetical protein
MQGEPACLGASGPIRRESPISQRSTLWYAFPESSFLDLANEIMEWIENRVARAARWLTAQNPAEVAVCLFVAVVSCALLAPWVQHSRDGARRTRANDNLRRVGTAMFAYVDVHQALPPGGTPVRGEGVSGTAPESTAESPENRPEETR